MFEELGHYQSLADMVVMLVNGVVVVTIVGAAAYFVKQHLDNKHAKDDRQDR